VGERCGIAAYSRALVSALDEFIDVTVEPIVVGKQSIDHYRDQAARLNESDVVHIQHEHSFWGGILPSHSAYWNLRYLLTKPVVLTAHTTTSLRELLKLPTERRPLHRLAKQMLLLRRGYRDSVEAAPFVTGRCIVHTREGGEALFARGANPKYIHVLPAGVPVPVPAPSGGAAFRERHGLADRRIVSLFGYIAPNKGYELTLSILDALPEDVVFVVAGGARNAEMEPYGSALRRRIAESARPDRVVITGYLAEEEVAEAMAASDVVVAPHTIATGSYSIMVPLAYGRPVVASDLACFREIAEQTPALTLFPSGDAAAYAAALRSVLADPVRRGAMAQAARVYAQAHTWREVARRTVTVYEEALADVERLGHHGPP